jgi:phosphoribosylglycinamide formyltransferase 2
MTNRDALLKLVKSEKPHYIVPEIEAINTDVLEEIEKSGDAIVIPTVKAVQLTMNREGIRDLAANQLKLPTSPFAFAKSLEELQGAIDSGIGYPCFVKPTMSSSGKGQSRITDASKVKEAWDYAASSGRVNKGVVIVEGQIHFDYEITLLTITQKSGETLFCAPIGHRQERGDYQESWLPMPMDPEHLIEAQEMAAKVTTALGGAGLWGVEFFITKNGAYFSELSPRPHDTGMVTLAGTQNFSEFELHARAILGLPIPVIHQLKNGASAVVLADRESEHAPAFSGLTDVMSVDGADVRIFGKPSTRPYRRMAVALYSSDEEIGIVVEKTKNLAAKISIDYK